MLVESRKTWKNYTEKHTEEMELKQEKMKVEHGLSKKKWWLYRDFMGYNIIINNRDRLDYEQLDLDCSFVI